jgi:hypothetical protein
MFEVRNLATITGQNRVERPTNSIVELTSIPFFCVLTEFLPRRARIYEKNIYQPKELAYIPRTAEGWKVCRCEGIKDIIQCSDKVMVLPSETPTRGQD